MLLLSGAGVVHLHDAVMQRLEEEAGITYEDVTLRDLFDVVGGKAGPTVTSGERPPA